MKNAFKEALKGPRALIGYWLMLGDPVAAEICATAGFDWLLLDGEHGVNDVRSLLAQLQALGGHGAQAIVRPVAGDPALIKQLLDIGAQTLLVPMVDTAEQAYAVVRATRYAPEGMRGEAAFAVRASLWGLRADYLQHANDEVCVLVQAESRSALENLDAILAIDGVDGVFIGPADLSASLGHRGDPGHPAVQAAIDDAIARIVASGKAAGIIAPDPAQAKRYIGLGCRFVAVGLDVRTLAQSTRALRAQFDGAPAPSSPAPSKASPSGSPY